MARRRVRESEDGRARLVYDALGGITHLAEYRRRLGDEEGASRMEEPLNALTPEELAWVRDYESSVVGAGVSDATEVEARWGPIGPEPDEHFGPLGLVEE